MNQDVSKLPRYWPICATHYEPMKAIKWEGEGKKKKATHWVCEKCQPELPMREEEKA